VDGHIEISPMTIATTTTTLMATYTLSLFPPAPAAPTPPGRPDIYIYILIPLC